MSVRFRLVVGCVFAASALVGAARAEDDRADTAYLSRKGNLEYQDASLASIVEDLGSKVGVSVRLDAAVLARGTKLTLSLQQVTWLAALEEVARRAGLRIRGEPGGVVLEERTPPPGVTLSGRGVSLRRAIADIVHVGSMSLVVSPEVQGSLDLDVKDEPWTKALRGVLGGSGLHAVVRGGILLVSPRAAVSGEVELGDEEPPLPITWPLRIVGSPWRGAIDVQVEEASVRDVMDEVGRRLGHTILVEPSVDAKVTLSLRAVPWREVVDRVAGVARLDVHQGSGYLALRPAPLVTLAGDGPVATQLALIARARMTSLVVGPGVSGSVLVDLRDARYEEVLAAIGSACQAHRTRVGPRGEVSVFTARPLDRAPEPILGESIVDDLDAGFADEGGPGRPIDVQVEEAALRDVMSEIGRRVGRTIVVEPSAGAKVTIALRRLPWRHAVVIVARICLCEIERMPGGVLVLTRPAHVTVRFPESDVGTLLLLIGVYSGNNILIAPDVTGTVALHLDALDWRVALRATTAALGLHVSEVPPGVTVVATTESRYVAISAPEDALARNRGDESKAFSVSFEEADLANVIAEIAGHADEPIVVAPGVKEKVTGSLRGLDWRTALAVVARLTHCELRRAKGTLLLEQAPKVTIQTTDLSARECFALLGVAMGRVVTVADDVKGDITFDLHELSYEAALRAVASVNGLDVAPASSGGFAITLGSGPHPRVVSHSERGAARASAPVVEPPVGPEKVKEIEVEADRLIEELATKEGDDLASPIHALCELMQTSAGLDVVEQKLGSWKKAGEHVNLALGCRLVAQIERGNILLRKMLHAKQTERYEELPPLFDKVRDLVLIMNAEPHDEFQQNADRLLGRAKGILDEGAKLKKIHDSYPLAVRGIVVDARRGAKNRAVIVLGNPEGLGRIYVEGDALLDGAGAPTPVEVVDITEGAVKLKVGDTEFLRELAAPD